MPKQISPNLLSWTVEDDPKVYEQAQRTANLPIIHDHVALMPDGHFGYGAPVGSVVATENAVIPSAVGVDIGCGMIAARLPLTSHDLPTNMGPLMGVVRDTVPAGVGKGHELIDTAAANWFSTHVPSQTLRDNQALFEKAQKQFGSLGSGNHFYEICLDELDRVWVVLHSGSRGVGKELAEIHIKRAEADFEGDPLEDPSLAWLNQGTEAFDAYIEDMLWAQSYAMGNREAMMRNSLFAMRPLFSYSSNPGTAFAEEIINCHHNFCQQETHGGKELWITRKGAIRASQGRWGIIPGSMGASTFLVTGKGEPLSWESCSHGAGRTMSRGQARRTLTVEDFNSSMAGKTWQDRDAESLLDEHPLAYKDIDEVMKAQSDLVEVQHTLHQVLNYKGTGDDWKSKKRAKQKARDEQAGS